MLFCAIGGYLIGLYRGYKNHEYDFDKGWNACIDEIMFVKNGGESAMIDAPEEIFGTGWDETREKKARELLRQLDELFDGDEDEIIDGGEY